jgi:tetratricopeptide (TPR) repeat protein
MVCNRSISDSQKVNSLGQLANFYYVFKLNTPGDSVLQQQLLIAELSNDSSLILQALFGDAILNIGESATSESFNKTISFVQKGIDYARANNEYNFLVLGYARMSEILRKRGQYDKAFDNSMLALSLLQNVTSDSVKAIAYIESGDTYLDRGKAVDACTNYNSAFDIAVEINSIALQSKIHHCIAELYKKLEDKDHAKQELNQSLALNKKNGDREGVLLDYYDLARLTEEKFFIQQTIQLADSLHDYKNLLNAKRLMLAYYYVIEKNEQTALQYLANEPDLKQSYMNDEIENYFTILGHIFFYSGNIDSALAYYQIAQPTLEKKFDHSSLMSNLQQIGECYSLKGNFPEAISYYRKALQISMEMQDLNTIVLYSAKLSDLYEKQSDYKNALIYSKQSVAYKDSLRQLSRENDISLLSIERENKKHENELFLQQQHDYNSRNIQYMGITIAIIVIFFMMLFVGSFPVSRRTVKIMGYFFFISLFEFIVLLIDNLVLAHKVHNQPLKLWIIKIGVIALLVPCQHFLEHHVISLLASKKLIEARTKFSLKKWWASITKPPASGDESLEEDTAVL